MKKQREKMLPSVTVSCMSLILIIGVIVIGIRYDIGTQMALFFGTSIAIIISLILGNPWNEIQDNIIKVISESMVAILIITIVGITIGVWIIGGAVPALLYYGLEIINPSYLLVLAFILCMITSVLTGTSYGSMATMGIAMMGIGISMGIPVTMVAGAVVSGSYFGDKMSPMSGSTNIASAMAGAPLYEHIVSMFYTTIPATIVVMIIYTVLGLNFSVSNVDMSNIDLIKDTLKATYNISWPVMIPVFIVLLSSIKRVPAVLGLGGSAIISIAFAVIMQGVSFKEVVVAGFSGFTSHTGVAAVDAILTRGGIKSIEDTIILVLLACAMGGALNTSGTLDIIVEKVLLREIKSVKGLVISTMVYCYTILLMSGNQMLGVILGGKTFQKPYESLDVNPKVLSRTLEDTSTIGAFLVPWSTSTAYITGVLGVGIGYIPYAFLGYIVPIFSIICVFTGIGIWRKNGLPYKRKDEEDGNTIFEASN